MQKITGHRLCSVFTVVYYSTTLVIRPKIFGCIKFLELRSLMKSTERQNDLDNLACDHARQAIVRRALAKQDLSVCNTSSVNCHSSTYPSRLSGVTVTKASSG